MTDANGSFAVTTVGYTKRGILNFTMNTILWQTDMALDRVPTLQKATASTPRVWQELLHRYLNLRASSCSRLVGDVDRVCETAKQEERIEINI